MLASSLRGYAPVVRGVADTNALVQIRQNGNLLREVSVPAGPFVIDDLFPTGYGGDIDVEILEANGERRAFTIPYTAAAQLIRPGYSRYLVAAGRYRYSDKVFDKNVAQATWQYGLSNG
ncbi:fimbria/pilus outer membrane usher protein [Escherichia coli]